MKLLEIAVTDGKTEGFNFFKKNLISLKNLDIPTIIGVNFNCNGNQLTTLEGAPKEVGGSFRCTDNKITSLKEGPKKVGGDFLCSYNQLTTLEGAPDEVGRSFYCEYNKLTSLKGAPMKVGKNFVCYDNKLTSLEGAPKEIGGDFICNGNQLTSLKGIHKIISKINGDITFYRNPIKSHVLGLLLIEGVDKIYINPENDENNNKLETILNKHLGKGKQGILDAQEELIDAGLDDYAEL